MLITTSEFIELEIWHHLIILDEGSEHQNCLNPLFHLPSPLSPSCWVLLQYVQVFLSSQFLQDSLVASVVITSPGVTTITPKLTYLILILDVLGNSASCFYPKTCPSPTQEHTMIPVASHAPSKVLGLTFHALHNLACPSHVPVILSVFATQCFAFFHSMVVNKS